MENDRQRRTRRAISSWLTEQENNFAVLNADNSRRLFGALKDGLGSAVRALVIKSLENLDRRFEDINHTMHGDKYHIRSDIDLVKFYMKGGNAFNCIVDPIGIGATQLGGGNSDWDTQVVIDPWVPQPIIDEVYGLIEDIVLDEFSELGIAIAKAVKHYNTSQGPRNPLIDFEQSVLYSWNNNKKNISDQDFSRYELVLDKRQIIRRVFDHDQTGLWFNSSSKPASPDPTLSKWIPGISFNDAIKPFVLYRLGYIWHAETIAPPKSALTGKGQQDMYAGDIKKPILMELIDVTIPRKNTIESVRVWEELIHNHIDIRRPAVQVKRNHLGVTTTVSAKLPLPDVFYHVSELATMLCEIADGSSRHRDKMIRRFSRLKQIWDISPVNKQRIKKTLSRMTGVIDIGDSGYTVASHNRVSKLVNEVTNAEQRKLLGLDGATISKPYSLILKMMNCVALKTDKQNEKFKIDGKLKNSTVKEALFHRKVISENTDVLVREGIISGSIEACFSDDLALLDYLLENGYIDISKVGFSGVSQAITIRAPDYDSLNLFTAKTASRFEVKGFQVQTKMYNTPRATRISYESLLVISWQGQAEKFIAFTTASAAEMPFLKDPAGGDRHYAPIADIANQRRVAAALLEDYIIVSAMSRQLEAVKKVVKI